MRVIEQYGMFSTQGDFMVDRVVRAALQLAQIDAASNFEVWAFTKRELAKLASTLEFAEAEDTVVREEVFGALFNTLPGFNLSEEEYRYEV
jgi:hypothetical protein